MDSFEEIQGVRRFCDNRAQHGREGAVRDPKDTRGLKNLFIETILQHAVHHEASFQEDQVVLDLGCGSGLQTEVMAPQVGQTIGLDISPRMLSLATHAAIPKALFAQFDGITLPFRDAVFDTVVTRELIHLLGDDVQNRLFSEVARTLKPGGYCLSVEFVSFNPRRQSGVGNRIERSPEAMIERMAACGLACDTHYPVRRGRSLTQYLVRYGPISRARVQQLALRELSTMRERVNYTTSYNAEWLFKFKRSK